MTSYWIILFALGLTVKGYSQADLLNQIVLNEVEQLGKLSSLRFVVEDDVRTTSDFEGIKTGATQKATFSYWSQIGDRRDLTNLFKYKLKLMDEKVGIVVDEVIVYDQSTFSGLDNRSGGMSVDIKVPGPDDLLRNRSGVFLPLRFIAFLSNGKPFEEDGFIFSLNRLSEYKITDFLKNCQVIPLSSNDKLVKQYWPDQTCFFVRKIPPLNETQVVTSFYVVAVSEQKKMILGWTYFENDSPIESLLIKNRVKLFNKNKESVELMSDAGMLHYYQGSLVSKSTVIVSDIILDEVYLEETFQLDPSTANSIYDRQTRELIRVPK